MSAGIVLFLIPVDYKKGIHALDWQNASKAIAWDVLLLFGGGLSMAAAIQSTGAADAVGACATFLAGLPEWGVLLGVTGIATMASEVTSNTALAATLMPLLGAVAKTLNMQPEGLLISATIGASLAFMMPVGTPPNAMVFATGKITIREMVRAGFWLNIIAILVVTAFCYIICPGVISSLTAPF